MITRQGKQYVLFAGLLDEAHSRGLRGIHTELIQAPNDANANVAVVQATVEMEDGRSFGGIGDASPDNVGRNIIPHLIRMAETRAKARALRDAVNVGAIPMEELSEDDGAAPTNYSSPRPQRPTAVPNAGPQPVKEADDNGQPATDDDTTKTSKRGSQKARKSQVDLLKTLAVEWRGDNGVERLESRIGKPLVDLKRAEADEWIDRLTPEGRE